MSYLSRHCNRRHQNIWPIHPISPALKNAHQNTYGRSKDDSSWFYSGNTQSKNQTQDHPGRHTRALAELSKIFKNETDLLPSVSPLPAQPKSIDPTHRREIRETPYVHPERIRNNTPGIIPQPEPTSLPTFEGEEVAAPS